MPEIVSHSSVLHTGIDVPAEAPTPLPTHPPRLLCLGRLAPQKGVDVALRAFARLRKRIPGVRLVIAGDGPERAALERLTAQLGLMQQVDFLGWIPPAQVYTVLNTATIVVMPSRWEGLPSVALQAAMMERPVVASRVGGLPEIVEHERTGLLIHEVDSAVLAEALIALLTAPARAVQMGQAARRHVQKVFAWETYVDTCEALYQKLIKGRGDVVAEQFGYPAGMPRQMAFPLEGLPAATQALRIRTNQEIYWDRLAIVYAEPCPQAKKMVLPLRTARLSQVGFPRRTTAAQRVPEYDYGLRRPFDDVRFLDGMYTNFGLVTPLLRDFDDAFAIFGPGEEVHMEFAGLADPPPAGWQRHFVLESVGWAKDMDLYTRDGETVGPLPTTGKPVGPRQQLHKRYQTRYASGFFQ